MREAPVATFTCLPNQCCQHGASHLVTGRMHGNTRWLVDDQEPLVFEEDRKVEVARRREITPGLVIVDGDEVAGSHSGARPGASSSNLHSVLASVTLDDLPGSESHVTREELVDPPASLMWKDFELEALDGCQEAVDIESRLT